MYRLLVLVNPEHMVGYVSLMKGRPSQSRMLKDGFALIRQIRDRHNAIRTYPHTREAKKLLPNKAESPVLRAGMNAWIKINSNVIV